MFVELGLPFPVLKALHNSASKSTKTCDVGFGTSESKVGCFFSTIGSNRCYESSMGSRIWKSKAAAVVLINSQINHPRRNWND